MELKIDRKLTKEIIEQYYKEQFDIEGTVSITARKETIGYYETVDCVTTIKLKGTMNVMNKKVPCEINVTPEETKNAFNYALGREGYEVENVTFDDGINETYKGYGPMEYKEYKPYFNGVNVQVKNNFKQKKIGVI